MLPKNRESEKNAWFPVQTNLSNISRESREIGQNLSISGDFLFERDITPLVVIQFLQLC